MRVARSSTRRHVVGAEDRTGRRSRDGQRTERLLARAQRHADHRGGVDSVEETIGRRAARALSDRRHDFEPPAPDRGADAVFGLLPGARLAGLVGLDTRDHEALELVSVVGHVDDAPVGEVPHEELGDPLQGSLLVERRRELVARAAEEIEPRLPLGGAGGGRPLGGQEALALVLGPLPLADVAQEDLRVERLPAWIPRGRCLLLHPDDAAVSRDQPVLGARGNPILAAFELGQHAGPVLGMQKLREEVGLFGPLGR